ncbi:class II aldolase/adducin family protein [Actinoalloteichus hymeniacidonis]|uniref:Ribulose-5-phosphate 4-epimerase-like epimerase or aldolase n=1 Tax=Actinoalloteichus hymeniacidonis TaxID=340345 RepID=A0AAC9HR66_9PSEU|nr:class II aldolase/adducin family protein [Actinoalloteichus hymeniacidonis]AOS63471.1 ribulose-5-phosphate 4-epimerase-like epimerase or aldolase [Actinoalloteichus hymeniacidonis]MBB5908486.1 ribulose-5-phosphate 4-epimerase/fuculose-1-phosphate aldolase [Actinoalloteichus hymeniacidonis]
MTDLRQTLVEAGRRLDALGLSPGTSGNLSVRDGDRILMTPTGVSLGELSADSLSVLDLGRPAPRAHLDGPKASKEFPLHQALYRRDPEVDAVVHLHSTHAAAYSCLPAWSEHSAMPPVTPYFVMNVGQLPLIPYAAPGDQDQAMGIEELDFPFRAVLLQNHGPVVGGPTMDRAVALAIEIEETARLLLALGSRTPRMLDESEIRELTERYRSPWTTAAAG